MLPKRKSGNEVVQRNQRPRHDSASNALAQNALARGAQTVVIHQRFYSNGKAPVHRQTVHYNNRNHQQEHGEA